MRTSNLRIAAQWLTRLRCAHSEEGDPRPRVRAPARRPRGGPRRVDVDRTLLATVPRDLRGDALRLPDDPANRAGEGAAAPRRDVGHRGLHGGRVYVARLVQRTLHPTRGRDADGLQGP